MINATRQAKVTACVYPTSQQETTLLSLSLVVLCEAKNLAGAVCSALSSLALEEKERAKTRPFPHGAAQRDLLALGGA
jgi:hypothetical protein